MMANLLPWASIASHAGALLVGLIMGAMIAAWAINDQTGHGDGGNDGW